MAISCICHGNFKLAPHNGNNIPTINPSSVELTLGILKLSLFVIPANPSEGFNPLLDSVVLNRSAKAVALSNNPLLAVPLRSLTLPAILSDKFLEVS